MKYLRCSIFIFLISACSGTKQVVDKIPENENSVFKKDITTIIESEPEEKEALKFESDSVNNRVSINKNEGDKITQILSKPLFETHASWNDLLQKHVSNNGNVDYKGFKKYQFELNNYFKVLNDSLPNETHSREYSLAFWINAYNAFTIDLILRNYPIKSIKDIKNPWDQRLWKLGNKWYNLNDIEHQILRKMDEPRIHFAIVCASVSCPKLRNEAYTAEKLEQQLTKATKDFLNDSSKNTLTSDKMELSKIFQWFTKDFTQNGSLIDFINQYYETEISSQAKKTFKEYNWDLNE